MTGTSSSVNTLFPTYMAEFTNEQLAEGLKKFIVSLQSSGIQSNIATEIKHNLNESKFDFFRSEEYIIKQSVSYFAGCLRKLLNQLYREDSIYKVNFVDSWYHIGKKNSVHHVHKHPGCSWCGIYYVNPGQTSTGSTVFLSPIGSDFKDYGNKYLFDNEAIKIKPAAGKLVLFPSYLQHFQSLYEGDDDRIVIAFNCAIHKI